MVRTSPFIALLLLGLGAPADAQTLGDSRTEKPRADALGDPLPPGAILRLGTVRWRPSGSIHHLAFAPDGKRLASWHDEHHTSAAATIWEVASGRELRRVEAPGLGILSWTWLSDGRGISVVGTSEGTYVWEFSDDSIVPPHTPQTSSGSFKVEEAGGQIIDKEQLAGFAVSPDGKYLVAGKSSAQRGKERDIVLWGLKTQSRVADLPKPRRLGSVPNSCRKLFFTPDSSKLAVFCQPLDKKQELKEYLVAVLDAVSGKELRRFTTEAPMPQGMTIALSAQYLALGLEDEKGTVLLWDLQKDQDRRLTSGHGKRNNHSGFGVSALTFSSDGKTLITAGRDGAVRTWDVATSKESRVIPDAYPGWIETLAVTADGKRLACAGQDGMIRHWDLTTGSSLDTQPGHSQRITAVSVTPDGMSAVTSSADRRLRIWDLATGREQRTIELPATHRFWPHAVIAPDGRTVVVTVADKIMAWNVASGQELPLPEQLAGLKIGHVDFAPDGKTLVAIQTGAVTLLDWPSGKTRRSFKLPDPLQKPGEAHCDAATLSGDGRWLATSAHRSWHREERGMRFGYAADGVLDLWDATTGARVHRLVDGVGVGRTAIFTAEGDLLFAGGGKLHPRADGAEVELQGELHLIDPLTGRLKQSFEPAPVMPAASHRYHTAIGIAPNGRSIFCAGNDGVIHIYETATGKIRRSLARHRGSVSGLAFTADGRRLLTGSSDLTALVWDISFAAVGPKGAAAPAAEQARLWEQLLAPDAKAAYAAMATLAAHPPTAVAVIRAGIQPAASSPTDATLDRLFADLGDDLFAVRERATRELDALGEAAVAGMRARLAKSPALETQRRMVRFLEKHDPATLTPVHLREIRALEILEQLQTAESRKVLEALAKGATNARLTRSAAAVLGRQR